MKNRTRRNKKMNKKKNGAKCRNKTFRSKRGGMLKAATGAVRSATGAVRAATVMPGMFSTSTVRSSELPLLSLHEPRFQTSLPSQYQGVGPFPVHVEQTSKSMPQLKIVNPLDTYVEEDVERIQQNISLESTVKIKESITSSEIFVNEIAKQIIHSIFPILGSVALVTPFAHVLYLPYVHDFTTVFKDALIGYIDTKTLPTTEEFIEKINVKYKDYSKDQTTKITQIAMIVANLLITQALCVYRKNKTPQECMNDAITYIQSLPKTILGLSEELTNNIAEFQGEFPR